jgi:hypothetical protein
MKVNRIYAIAVLLIVLIIFGCDTGLEGTVNPGPVITGNDPFNDLTVLNDRFYLTNYDRSGAKAMEAGLTSIPSIRWVNRLPCITCR